MNTKRHTSPATVPFLPDDIALIAVCSREAVRVRRHARNSTAWDDPDVKAVRRAIKHHLSHYDGLHTGHDYAIPVRQVVGYLEREHRRGNLPTPGTVTLANALNLLGGTLVELVTQRSATERRAS